MSEDESIVSPAESVVNSEQCNIAFKEWAVICEAIATGRQQVIVRKGGIHEGREGFRVKHNRFWLFPTGFHQGPESLRPEYQDVWMDVNQHPPESGRIRLDTFVEVAGVQFLTDEDQLADFEPQQALNLETLTKRFHYRRPGLFVLTIRAHRPAEPLLLADDKSFAGCRSWVEF